MDKRLRRKLDPFKDQVIYAYEVNQLTMEELAELYGVNEGTVSRFLKKYKAKIRSRGRIIYEERYPEDT